MDFDLLNYSPEAQLELMNTMLQLEQLTKLDGGHQSLMAAPVSPPVSPVQTHAAAHCFSPPPHVSATAAYQDQYTPPAVYAGRTGALEHLQVDYALSPCADGGGAAPGAEGPAAQGPAAAAWSRGGVAPGAEGPAVQAWSRGGAGTPWSRGGAPAARQGRDPSAREGRYPVAAAPGASAPAPALGAGSSVASAVGGSCDAAT